mmetsp:Transcript_12643/g.23648  ORF Transcript_12643/g.23648 Transcript_12643/m.23648 type:complete len:81 (-) Transcript_12643:36-278(-)
MAAKSLVFGAVTGFLLTAHFCDKISADKRNKLEELDRLEREITQEVQMRSDEAHKRSLGCGTIGAYRNRMTEGLLTYFRE